MTDALLGGYDAVLLDLDGTVYHGSRVIPGVPEVAAEIRARGVALRFVTNNAARSPAEVAAHLRNLGVDAQPAEVATSAQAAAALLRERLPPGAAVVVVGSAALADEVAAAGLRPVRKVVDGGPEPAGVVQGHSPGTGWADLAEAAVALRAGALWVASNTDVTLPSERGMLPGNGAMVAALRAATGLEPLVAGKPEAGLLATAAGSAGASAPLVVGDRLDTDIAGASAAGVDAMLVLTGVDTPASLLVAPPGRRPRFVAAGAGALLEPADRSRIGPRPGWRVELREGRLHVDGEGDPLDLLRSLCEPAWGHGPTAIHAAGTAARDALAELGLG